MRRALRAIRGLFIVAVIAAIGAVIYMATVWNPGMPELLVARVNRIATAHGGYTPLDKIPNFLQRAVIATEDRSFYQNDGIDFEGIARALVVDAIHMKPVQGASTITEQLVKDIFLTDNKTIQRKLKQIALAVMISKSMSKNEVLSLYLNEVYLGNGAYGVGQAAELYFGRNISQLSPAQCALLAGLPQAPSAYDPLIHLAMAKQRQWEVLESMVSAHDLSQAAAAAIAKAPLYLE
ncbi:MAG: transglycosylase domain-containing protein [Firmicutes bacterium]|nr:transglycosylase domain-containing protein [Bacillota bacterium]